MKKVRFEMIPANYGSNEMQDNNMDCHYPRPFMMQGENPAASSSQDLYSKILKMKSDPLKVYENSNSSPYSLSQKTVLHHAIVPEARIEPSNELELSMLDASSHEPRQPAISRNVFPTSFQNTYASVNPPEACQLPYSPVLTSSKDMDMNKAVPNKAKDDSFFIKHNNINIGQVPSANCIPKQFTKLSMDKENNPIMKKAEIIQKAVTKSSSLNSYRDSSATQSPFQNIEQNSCKCHHCNVETVKKTMTPHNFHPNKQILQVHNPVVENIPNQCPYALKYCMNCVCEAHSMKKLCQHSNNQTPHACQNAANNIVVPQNALEKKISMIQNFELSKKGECTDIERSTAISKETQEPTVADLFKIIKLQSEQLQLLQEKVDKFISVSNKPQPTFPVQNYVSEQIALETVNNDHHKISIGVMTSFEMVTSTFINKEVVKQTISNQNAQVQCNRSQISIKEVAIREPVHQNFLDGIQKKNTNTSDSSLFTSLHETDNVKCNNIQPVEEKTFNDMSLCNVQVDNATTPLISPDQSMYLDVRDYSESDSGSNDQSNVGWTYYNKVMTHVNGMLQDSDMPSSASALHRNTRQHCLQMQIDKTNISVTKRVKFGDDPLGLHQPHLYPPSDTSMKMNQLAAKYLNATSEKQLTCSPRNNLVNNEMSFATRNYMERHQLLQGSRTPAPEMPRFLDITALKRQQQHKLL